MGVAQGLDKPLQSRLLKHCSEGYFPTQQLTQARNYLHRQ